MLVERSETPSDSLRAWILSWRSRCYRRQRDYETAHEDIQLALEVAESIEDTPLWRGVLAGITDRRA